jgi:hypothetical protein
VLMVSDDITGSDQNAVIAALQKLLIHLASI